MNWKTIAAAALLSIQATAQQDVPLFFRRDLPAPRVKLADPIREIGGTNYWVENLFNAPPNPTRARVWFSVMVEVLSLDGTDLVCENGITHQTMILRNYPKADSTPTGSKFSTEAAKVGTTKRTNRFDKVSVVDVWDYGTPITEAELKAKPLPKRPTESRAVDAK